ncbi:S9 family peptidase [Micrococcus sp. TA1]|uniref:S9 family peptidase n=2 Tax=Micrococcaceae TaxID=1268 RepID=UPI00160D9FF6|nr:S9 family peptidase [Micrococcus sp. TA1]MBB5748963.1 dipeptidyl aminopeptidase/acylaminoacyl peptidase [Micrococcus sp. TA1]
MRPEQLDLITSTGTPSLTPDGRHLVVATSRADFGTDGYTGQLWLISTDGAAPPRRLTRGYRDAGPRVAPDGRSVAFLRTPAPGTGHGAGIDRDTPADSAPQLVLLPLDGGEARFLTDRPLGVTQFNWSPDSSRIVFSAAVPEAGRYGTLPDVGPAQEDPRLFTGPDHRENGRGYTTDQRAQLFEIELPDPDGEPVFAPRGRAKAAAAPGPAVPPARQLTGGEREATDPVYAADGRHVFFTTTPGAGAGLDLRTAVAVVDTRAVEPAGPHDGSVRLVAGGREVRTSFSGPCVSRNGEWLYLHGEDVGESGLEFVAANTGVYAVPAPTALRHATAGWDRPAATLRPRLLTDADGMNCSGGPLQPSGQDNVLALAEQRGRRVLVWMSHHGHPETIVDLRGEVTGASEAGGNLAVSYTTELSPGSVGIQHRGTGLTELFDPNDPWRRDAFSTAGLEREYRVQEGVEPGMVHGWVFVPSGPGPHPVVLNIHGGPYAQYTWSWFDETQVLVEAGYAVVMCNPRGSNGYGSEHGSTIRERLGTVDRQDILGFLEAALDEFGPGGTGVLDADRMGVMGGSYGGYMTAWITAHDHRFTAAIVERGFLDPVSALGSSDIGWFFTSQYFGDDHDHVRTQSPLQVVDRVRTPTLVIHSEQDLRCPIEHAQRYYHALWASGVESELLVFPGEDHELSRSGTPWHRRARFEHVLRWWDRHLPVSRGAGASG